MSKTTNSLNVFLLLFFLMDQSWAVRKVGNGGGLSEMKFIYLFQNSTFFITPCLSISNPCTLTSEERLIFVGLQKKEKLNPQNIEIEFESKLDLPFYFRPNENRLSVKRSLLYLQDGQFETNQNLIALALAVQMSLFESKDPTSESFLELKLRLRDIFNQVQTKERMFRPNNIKTFVQLTALETKFQNTAEKIYILEDHQDSFDISLELAQALPCGSPLDWDFSSWTASSIGNHFYFVADASASCHLGENVSLILNFQMTPDRRFQPDSINVKFRSF